MKIICDGGMVSCNTKDTMDAIMLTKNIAYLNGIKVDIQKTKDNIVVLAPSNDLSTFTLSNKKISSCPYEYLRKVKFPSHIFKYYIPTLEEFLQKYNYDKLVVLEIYDINVIELLYNILLKYPYQYFFLSHSNYVLSKLQDSSLNKIGTIIDDNSNIKVFYSEDLDDKFNQNDNNLFLITEHPEKILRKN